MSKKAIKKEMNKVGGSAVCEDCDYAYSNPTNMNANAARHAKAFNHKVVFELRIEGFYDGRVEDED